MSVDVNVMLVAIVIVTNCTSHCHHWWGVVIATTVDLVTVSSLRPSRSVVPIRSVNIPGLE